MKRIVCFLLVVLNISALSSCGGWSIDRFPENTETVESERVAVTDITDRSVYYPPESLYVMDQKFISIPGAILFQHNERFVSYYDLATGECHPFCFDPTCKHKLNECLFNKLTVTNDFVYYDGYIYLAYIDRQSDETGMSGIARMSLDGSNMEVLYRCQTLRSISIHAAQGYILLVVAEGSESHLYCYEIATGELIEEKKSIYPLVLVTDQHLLYRYNSEANYRLVDLKNWNESKTPIAVNGKIYYKKRIYYIAQSHSDTTATAIHAYDPYTNNDEFVVTVPTETIGGFYCITDNNLYYSPYEGLNAQTVDLTKIDLETGETQIILKDFSKIDGVSVFNGRIFVKLLYGGHGELLGPNEKGKHYVKLFTVSQDEIYPQ